MNGTQLISVPGLLTEAARLHWQHMLVLVGTTAIYAPGIALAGDIAVDVKEPIEPAVEGAPPFDMTAEPATLLIGLTLIVALSATAFVLWLRIPLLGAAAALRQPLGDWTGQVIRTMGLLVGAILLGLVPVSMIAAVTVGSSGNLSAGGFAFLLLMASAAINGAIAFLLPIIVVITLSRQPPAVDGAEQPTAAAAVAKKIDHNLLRRNRVQTCWLS